MPGGSLVSHVQIQAKCDFRTITLALKVCRHVEVMMWFSLLITPTCHVE